MFNGNDIELTSVMRPVTVSNCVAVHFEVNEGDPLTVDSKCAIRAGREK